MSDLTAKEQENVRAALRFIHTRCGTWALAAKAIRAQPNTLRQTAAGRAVSASMAVRAARFAGVSVDDVLIGRFPPPGTCPHCGHRDEARSDTFEGLADRSDARGAGR
jgi:hypothetical protein